jgi:hypothetical protein
MEMDVDHAVAARFGEVHEFYCRNLKVFKSFAGVFERFFKKEKYANAGIKADPGTPAQATIRFCGSEYRLRLDVDTADLRAAGIVLERTDREGAHTLIAQASVTDEDSVIFAGNTRIFLKDRYEFTNAVLAFFIGPATQKESRDRTER